MRYPTISVDDVARLTEDMVGDQEVDVVGSTTWTGEGDEIEVDAIDALADELRDDLQAFRETGATDKDAFEGRASAKVHAALATLPLHVLDDPGFWRYLTVAKLWEIVRWREAGGLEKGWSKYRVYVDGRNPAECVLLRMFLRGQVALTDGRYDLASAVPQATDLWRSHIIRVRTSYSPTLAQQLLREQIEERMNTDDLRALAKRIQRVASNVLLHTYDEAAAAQLIRELREEHR